MYYSDFKELIYGIYDLAKEIRSQGELYVRGKENFIVIPYGLWRNLCIKIQAIEDGTGKTPDTPQKSF